MPVTTPVSGRLRAEVDKITTAWEHVVVLRLPDLQRLGRAALLDHMPEFLFGLAAWIDGDEETGRKGFTALVQGHALQRLGHGIGLDTLSMEYQVMRSVILTHVLEREAARDVAGAFVRLNEGVDYAMNQAVQQYTGQRDEIRQRFVGILGHDLRNPLNAIALAAEQIATMPCDEPKHRQATDVIRRSADRMNRMVADVIDFTHARIGQGIPAVPTACVMSEIVEEAAGELRLAHPTRTLRVDAEGDTSGTWDRDRVLQVVSNLIGNALQHGRDPVIVRVTEAPNRRSVILRVENSGPRIPPQSLARLFDPFHQGAQHRGPREHLGLGLFIVEQVAIAHGARVEVTSDDALTAFQITWPRIPRELVPNRP